MGFIVLCILLRWKKERTRSKKVVAGAAEKVKA